MKIYLPLIIILLLTGCSPPQTYDVYLGPVENEPAIHIAKVLDSANEGDTVIIHISSHGGYVRDLQTIVTAIESSRATVITSCEGYAYSAAGVILLAGDKMYISRYCILMLHLARTYDILGNVNVLPLTDPSNIVILQMLMYHNVGSLLTEEDVIGIISGKDVYISASELVKRLDNPYTENYLNADYVGEYYEEYLNNE